jgi:PEP-CTERM motif-containing protein
MALYYCSNEGGVMTARFSSSGQQFKVLFSILAISILSLASRNIRASELFSESVYVPPLTALYDGNPVTGWNGFNVLLSADPVLPAQNASDTNTDPFAVNGTSTITVGLYTALATDAGIPVGPGLFTLPGQTRVHFSGTVPINQSNIPNQNLSNPTDQVQFGLVGPTDNTPLHILAQHWVGSYTDFISEHYNYLRGVPVVSIIPNPAPPAAPPNGISFDYIVDFVQFTEDGISGSEWAEFPYVPGNQPTFTYGGWADPLDPIHFTNHEIQLSDTLIPLDDLNFADDPLSGGINGPAFIPAALPADIVPEPASFMLLVLGTLGLLSLRRTTSKRCVAHVQEKPGNTYRRRAGR